ncbi:facilitated trehalose transporter Tret1 [Halyomorpha halys]|uniref:facilitated trehalose transporter Tret1 n=1 Tax=Halyomorpha halys TaxID=286706 RepID=UPI0006D51DA2|nr:facilitated trehalose transporter Tret1 [Halyomorpha halys]
MEPRSLATLRQYVTAASASLSVIILGTSLGWPSPVLPRMQDEGTPFFMSYEEISWMVSLLYLGNLMSPIPAGYLMDILGRKNSLLVLTIIPLSAWVMIIFAEAPIMLYFARFLAGTWSGIVSTIAPMYLAEISEPRVRGALSTFVQLMTNLGVLFEYVIGPIVSYKILGYFSGSLPIIFIIIFFGMPESPYWLLMKGKKEKAAKSLAWLRGLENSSEVKEELETLENVVTEEMRNKKRLKDLVETKGNRKALLVVEALAIFQRMSGISALMAYTSTTLPKAGAGSLSPNDCVIVMGLVWVVSVFVATVLVDSLGRKPLLLTSSIGCCMALFAAGLWFFLDEKTNYDVTNFYWVPFGSFLVYGFSFCIGLGPIASTIQGEAFPTNIKALASGITSVVLAVTSFIMNKIYHTIADEFGMYLNYWIFSGACLTSTIFVLVYLVETKGKTLHEIHEELNKTTKKTIPNNEGA